MQPQESITESIASAVSAGKLALVERTLRDAEAARRREEDWQAQVADKWAPHLATLTAALPQWAHPFVVAPTYEYVLYRYGNGDNYYLPVAIRLPNLADIFAYIVKDDVYFAVARPGRDEDGAPALLPDDAEVAERYLNEVLILEQNFAVAVMTAKESFDQHTRMLDSWEQRPAVLREPAPDPVPLRQRLDAIDTAGEVVDLLEAAGNTPAEQGVLWGMLSIATELRGIRIAVEDIAAALLADETEA